MIAGLNKLFFELRSSCFEYDSEAHGIALSSVGCQFSFPSCLVEILCGQQRLSFCMAPLIDGCWLPGHWWRGL